LLLTFRAATVAVAGEVEVEVEGAVEVAVNPRQMATRRWCRNRIKKRPLSERQRVSDASRFRCQRRVQSAQRTAIVGVAFFAYFFGEEKK
jgi:hypothetical protein